MVCGAGLWVEDEMVNELPALAEGERARLIYEAAMRQLERMRAMQYAYHGKFFTWLGLVLVVILALVLWTGGAGWLFIPFVVVTAGVQASFYLHFCDFARTHAARLEAKLNEWLGVRVLLGGEIERLYFYDDREPKVSGFLPTTPGRFFSVFTLHWTMLWAVLFGVGLTLSARVMEPFWAMCYVVGALGWAGINFGFIAWYFWGGRDEKAVADYLDRELFGRLKVPDAGGV